MTTVDGNNPWEDEDTKSSQNSSERKHDKRRIKNDDEIDEILRRGQKKIIDLLNMQRTSANKRNNKSRGSSVFGEGGGSSGLPAKKLLLVLIIVVLGAWFSTGFYTVQPDEQGVVMRFGGYHRISGPGLNYKLPTPFESVTVISVTRVNKEEIGFRSAMRDSSRRGRSQQSIPQESQMLTGDENLIDIDFDVQWVIKDAKQFLFNVRDLTSENTVKNAAESAMREVMGQVGIADALAEERNDIEFRAKTLLQEILDSYGMGVQILRLQMLRVEPPPQVLAAYRDVQSAKADRESEINNAFKYRNDKVPNARGDAQAILQEAESYKKQRIAIAEGEAGRFNEIYRQYVRAKDVTRKRMYLETLEYILAGMNKIILDGSASNSGVLPYLPLNQVQGNTSAPKRATSSSFLEQKSYTGNNDIASQNGG